MVASLCVPALGAPLAAMAQAAVTSSESVEAGLSLTRAQRVLVQRGLTALGFDVGAADGIFGPRTRAGIGKWQSSRGEPANGRLGATSAAILLKAGEEASPPGPPRTVVEEATAILSEALSAARRITDGSKRAEAFSKVAEAQAQAGDISEALSTARRIEGGLDRTQALGAVAEAQAKTGENLGAARSISEALSTARRIAADSERAMAFSTVAEAQAKAGDSHGASWSISEALSAARRIEDRPDRAVALVWVANAQRKAGNIAKALNIAQSIEDHGPLSMALSAVAVAQAKAGDSHGASRSISEALSAAQRTPPFMHKHYLREVAKSQAKAGDISGALSIARKLEGYHSDWVLRAVAEAQAKEGDISEALSTARRIEGDLDRARALSATAEAQKKAGDSEGASRSISEALSTARRIGEDGTRSYALSAVATAQAKAGDNQAAARSISEALNAARSVVLDDDRAAALSTVAVARLRAGNLFKAQVTARTQRAEEQPQKAAISCEGWNTETFFRRTDAAEVVRCLEADDPNARDEKGRTPLHVAAVVSKQPAVVAALAKGGAELDTRDEKGRTPLHMAAVLGEPAIVTALMKAGAALDARDERGRTPLQLAEKFSKTPEVVNALRAAMNAENASKISASAVSCEGWNTEEFFASVDAVAVSRCLDDGASVGARDEVGATPLHRAGAHSKVSAVVSALLDAGARVSARDETGATPLHVAAAKSTSAAVVEALLDAGADAAAKDETGRTPRDYLEENPALVDTEISRRLAGISCEDWNTAIFFERADSTTVSRCLGEGAEVGARDEEEATPLHFAAARSEAPAVVEMLLDAGANAIARDKHGKVPWDYARTNPALKGTDVYWRLNEARFN